MKQRMTVEDWNNLSPGVQEFIIIWKQKKRYTPENPLLTLGEALELAIAVAIRTDHGHSADGFLHGTYNHVITMTEAQIGYDGEELIDTVVYWCSEMIKFRLAHTFNEVAEPKLPLDNK